MFNKLQNIFNKLQNIFNKLQYIFNKLQYIFNKFDIYSTSWIYIQQATIYVQQLQNICNPCSRYLFFYAFITRSKIQVCKIKLTTNSGLLFMFFSWKQTTEQQWHKIPRVYRKGGELELFYFL